ncbi:MULTISPECIES: DUF3969 family protein [Bacillus]|uniref:DUF3969 family protein n=1 Tax=Bacillus pumilus TaxID=1408 RepID=A0AAE3WLV8_BACPU|nr:MULTISPECIES: DUF3969 family protein [Bacillus]AOC58254.1 hypothetical protein BEN31_16425 [Bacillus pumilus]AZV54201.1 DUF3969 domain-containing protein [Bacillus pumilus]MBR0586962.1 DUF3969 family protein [Bacillus pumilus DW2J2]MBR0616194.1 DUF3969 family protein [Bacillus pumilus]MBR0620257.1 DUF3969 family protein [Bacillus pumilus]
MNKIELRYSSHEDLDRIIVINIIGIIISLKEGLITIEEAEKLMFSPRTIDVLKKKGINEELINILHLGTELEDVESLIPHELSDSLEEIRVKCLRFLERNIENEVENNVVDC